MSSGVTSPVYGSDSLTKNHTTSANRHYLTQFTSFQPAAYQAAHTGGKWRSGSSYRGLGLGGDRGSSGEPTQDEAYNPQCNSRVLTNNLTTPLAVVTPATLSASRHSDQQWLRYVQRTIQNLKSDVERMEFLN